MKNKAKSKFFLVPFMFSLYQGTVDRLPVIIPESNYPTCLTDLECSGSVLSQGFDRFCKPHLQGFKTNIKETRNFLLLLQSIV
jgi:hypothetical protein